jgi:Gametolysin peptidase M11
MKRTAMRATVGGLLFFLLMAAGEGAHAHNGDLQRLLAQGQPKPFAGGQAVKIEGEVEVIHGDDFEGPRSFVRYFVRTFAMQELLELGFDDPGSASLLTGQKVAVRGRRHDSTIWVKDVAALDSGETTSQGSTATAPVLSERTAIAILVNLSDATLCAGVTTCTYTPTYVADKIFTATQSMRALYLNSSYGQVTFKTDTDGNGQPDVVGPYNLSLSKVGCNWSSWGTAADSAAQAAGVDLSKYQHLIYVLPPYSQLPDCGWAGLAYVGGSKSFIAEPQSMMVYAHELGHNLNMAHAGTDPENDGVMNVEYGDSSDPMGSSRAMHNFNGAHTHQMGWFNAFTNAVQTVTASGSYQLAAIGTTPDGTTPQVLRIFKPNTSEYYYLSYRQATGFDASLSSTYTQGVNIHRYKGSGYAYTYFLQPLSATGLFMDNANGITVAPVTNGNGTATVQVTFGCAATQPAVSLTPSSVWVKSGSQVSLSAQVTNRDSSGCAGTTFSLSTGVTTGGSGSVSPGSVGPLASAQVGSATVVVTPTNSGTVTLTAHDSDGRDPVHSQDGVATAQINIDASAPAAPSGLTATVGKPGGIVLGWKASTDSGSGVKSYYIYRNTALIGTTTTLSFTDASGVDGTLYTYGVTAVDQVGNESGLSNTVSITYMAPSKGGGNKRKR